MSLLTYSTYVRLTGDTLSPSASIEEMIEDAETSIEEFLDRPLALAERTEVRRVDIDGRVYPKATPVTSLPASATYQIENTRTLKYVTPHEDFLIEGSYEPVDGYFVHQDRREITYTGGWTEASAPGRLLRAIANLAYVLAHPTLPDASVGGASSVSLGDASVGYGAGGAPGAAQGRSYLESQVPGIETQLSRYRWVEDYS